MRQFFLGGFAVLLLSGCAGVMSPETPPEMASADGQTRPKARDGALVTTGAPVPEGARTVEEFDTTTAQERSAAQSGDAKSEVVLGRTIASLGTAAEPGFWLKTPLVTEPAKGRVVYPATGKSVNVDLIPIDGPKTAGSRMSLSAMRLIDAPLTGLPEVEVYLSSI